MSALFFVVTDDDMAAVAFVKLADTDMFPSAPATGIGSTTVVLGSLVTNPGTIVERLEFPGTWRGVPGTFICSDMNGCNILADGISVSASLDEKGKEVLVATFGNNREWVFQPDDKAATADVDDEDYLYFGWWKNEPAEADARRLRLWLPDLRERFSAVHRRPMQCDARSRGQGDVQWRGDREVRAGEGQPARS